MAEQEWKIAKRSAECQGCTKLFEPAAAYYSVLLKNEGGLLRQDFCDDCFQNRRPADVFYFWKNIQPAGERDKRLRPVLDLDCALDFMRRLENENAPQQQAFRYILALMLVRKKVLALEGAKADAAGNRIQIFREKLGGQLHEVLEPTLNAEAIADVSAELGALLGFQPKAENVKDADCGTPVAN